MPRLLDHFGGHVLCGPAERVGDFAGVEAGLAESEVSNLYVAVVVDEKVLGLEVAVDDVLLVEVHQTIEDFDEVEASVVLAHPFDCFQIVEELSAGAV